MEYLTLIIMIGIIHIVIEWIFLPLKVNEINKKLSNANELLKISEHHLKVMVRILLDQNKHLLEKPENKN